MRHEQSIRRNWLLMELSALLFIVGSLLLYRCGPEVDFMFALGAGTLAVATGLFRAARSRLMERVEQLWKARGLSAEHARDRALEYVEHNLLAEAPPFAPTQRVVGDQQSAAECRWPRPLLIS